MAAVVKAACYHTRQSDAPDVLSLWVGPDKGWIETMAAYSCYIQVVKLLQLLPVPDVERML